MKVNVEEEEESKRAQQLDVRTILASDEQQDQQDDDLSTATDTTASSLDKYTDFERMLKEYERDIDRQNNEMMKKTLDANAQLIRQRATGGSESTKKSVKFVDDSQVQTPAAVQTDSDDDDESEEDDGAEPDDAVLTALVDAEAALRKNDLGVWRDTFLRDLRSVPVQKPGKGGGHK